LARVLSEQASGDRCLIVDCLTLWLSNHLAAPQVDEAAFQRERQALLDVIPALPGALYLIGTEVGQGIVPMHPLSRRFVDEAGWLHQALAARCERVVWVTAGLPQLLKTS
jgi:adenosylcobinamide kinase/adenosylcobinamide-phosphate guanylyltransferase